MSSPTPGKIEPPAERSGRIPRRARRAFVVAMTIAVVTSSFADVLLRKGMVELDLSVSGSLSSFIYAAGLVFSDAWLIAGVILMVIHFIAFVRALRLGPLSVVVPLRACTYIFTTLLARYFLQEEVNAERWFAILLILFGVSLVGLSARGDQTPEKSGEKA